MKKMYKQNKTNSDTENRMVVTGGKGEPGKGTDRYHDGNSALGGEMSNYNETYRIFTNVTSIKNNTNRKRRFHQFALSPGKPRNCQPG